MLRPVALWCCCAAAAQEISTRVFNGFADSEFALGVKLPFAGKTVQFVPPSVETSKVKGDAEKQQYLKY